jgi:hypothetical protein
MLRLYIAEGIPFVFRKAPMLYQLSREWLSLELSISPRDITLIGSARTGFSMSPPPKFGKEFSPKSDLDFSVISECWFEKLLANFQSWSRDYDDGKVVPANNKQKQYWDENIGSSVPHQLDKGFVDPHLISTLPRYSDVVKLLDARFRLESKLKASACCPPMKDVSIRVYKDFDHFVSHMDFNLALVSEKLKSLSSKGPSVSDRIQCGGGQQLSPP